MHVTVTCTDCSRQLRLPSEVIGRSVSCPLCKATFLTRRLDDDRVEAVPMAQLVTPAPRMELDDPADRGEVLEVLPAAPPDEILDALPADPPPRAELPSVARFPAVRFILFVQKDPADRLDGRFQAEVDHQGLRLWRGSGRVIRVPLGSKAEHLGGARLRVEVEGRRVTMLVVRSDGHAPRLAADVCDFLTRKTDRVALPGGTPWAALTLAVLPLAVPVLAAVFGEDIGGTGGVVAFGLLALVVTAVGLLVALRSSSPVVRGLVTSAGLALVYFIFGIALAVDLGSSGPRVPAAAWRTFTAPDGRFTVSLPGAPRDHFLPHGAFQNGGLRGHQVRLAAQQVTFAVFAGDYGDGQRLPAAARVDDLRRFALNTRPGRVVEREDQLWQNGFPGRHLVLRTPGGGREQARVFASDTRGYVLLAEGARMTADSADARRFFNSFTIREAAIPLPDGKKEWKDDKKEWKDDKKADDHTLGPWGRLLGKNDRTFRGVGIAPDGRVVAVSEDGVVHCWTAQGGLLYSQPTNLGDTVEGVAVSPDGRTVAVVGARGGLCLVDTATRAVRSIPDAPGSNAQWGVAFSSDGRRLARARGPGHVQLVDVAAGRMEKTMQVGNRHVVSVAFAPDGVTLAAGDGNGGVHVCDPARGVVLRSCPGHGPNQDPDNDLSGWRWRVAGLSFSRDGRTLAGVGHDRALRVWDAEAGTARRSVAHGRAVTAVAFHPAGRLVATGAADGQVRIWDAATGQERGSGVRVNPQPAVVHSLAFSPDGGRLAVAVGGRAEVWEVERRIPLAHADKVPLPFSPRHLTRLEVGGGTWTHEIGPTAMSRDHARFAFWGKDRLIRVWGSATLKAQAEIAAPEVPRGLAFHPTKKLIAHGRGSTVVMYREDTEEVVTLRPTNAQNVAGLDFSPDGKWLATCHQGWGAAPAEVRLWDVAAGKEVRAWKVPNGAGLIAFTADSLGVVTAGSGDVLVRLWEVGTGRECLRLRGHSSAVSALAVSPDGKTLAAGGDNGLVILFDTGRWRERARLSSHLGRVHAVAFAPDGRTIATAGEDRRVRLHDAASATLLHTLEEAAVPRGVGFSPRDTLLVRCLDGGVERWDLTKIAALKARPAPLRPDLDRAPPPEVPDLAPATRVEPHLCAVVAPQRRAALVFTRDRLMLHYSYPEFELRGAWWVGAGVYRAALDGQRGLLYAATSGPRQLRRPAGQPEWSGEGDLAVYDVAAVLDGKAPPGRLRPAATLLRGVTLPSLLLSADGRWLAYLQEGRDGRPNVVGRFETTRRQSAGMLDLPGQPFAVVSGDGVTAHVVGAHPAGGKHPAYLTTVRLASFKQVQTVDVETRPDRVSAAGRHVVFVGDRGDLRLVSLLDAGSGKVTSRRRSASPVGVAHLAGERLYTLAQPPTSLDSHEAQTRLPKGILRVVQRWRAEPQRPLGDNFTLTPDGAHVICDTGSLIRLSAEVRPPAAVAPQPAVPAGKLALLSTWADEWGGRVLALGHSAGGDLLCGGSDQILRLRHGTTGVVRESRNAEGGVSGVAWSPDGKSWAAATWAGGIASGTGPTGRANYKSGVLAAGADAIAYTGDGRRLVAAADKGLGVWGGQLRREAVIETATPLTGVAVVPGGLAIAGGLDGRVRRFDLAAGKEKDALPGHAAEVRAVAVRADGKLFASADVDGKVKVWDADGKEKHTLEGHRDAVLCLAFAPGGRVLASGGIDGEVRLWDAETGKELVTQPGRRDASVYALAFAPDGRTLAGACGREVRRWDVAGLPK